MDGGASSAPRAGPLAVRHTRPSMTEHLPAAGPTRPPTSPRPSWSSWRRRTGSRPTSGTGAGSTSSSRGSRSRPCSPRSASRRTPRSRCGPRSPRRGTPPGAAPCRPCVVVRSGRPADGRRCTSRTASRCGCTSSWRTAAGSTWQQTDHWVEPRTIGDRQVGEATFTVPGDLPLGWHELVAVVGGRPPADAESARVPLVVTPDRLELPAAVADGPATWGLMTQLYSLRSRRSWGHGDLDDLAELARWSGEELGAGFVLINPLHAPSPTVPVEPSPYLPVTRRFASPLYVRVEQVPEHAYLTGAVRAEIERTALLQRAMSASVDPDRPGRRLGGEALGPDPAARRRPQPGAGGRLPGLPRARRARPGRLRDLVRARRGARRRLERLARAAADPRSAAVAAAREELAVRVDFFCWLQWVRRRAARRRAAAGPRVRDGAGHRARPRGRRAPGRRRHLGAAGRDGPRRQRRRAAGRVQPGGAGLVAAAVAAGPAGRGGLRALPRHAAHRAAARRRGAGRPHPRPVPAVVGAGGPVGGRGHVRPVRPRGAGRDPRAGGLAGRCRGGR